MKILVVLLYLLCLIILCKKVKGSPNVEEALGSGDGDYSLDDDTEEGEDEQYDYSQNKTATVENDDEYDDVYYEIVEQDDDTEEGEDEQYDFSQNMTETRDNDDEYDDVYYEIVEQTETNRFYFLPSSYPPTKKIFLSWIIFFQLIEKFQEAKGLAMARLYHAWASRPVIFLKMSHFLLFFSFSSVGHADNGLMPHRQPEPGLKREQQRRRVSNEIVPSRTPVVVTPNYSYPVTSPPPIQIQLILFYCSFLTLLFILVLLIVGEYKNLFFFIQSL